MRPCVVAGLLFFVSAAMVRGDDPPNPFAAPAAATRTDAFAGTMVLSDGKEIKGKMYLTRDHDFKIYDESKEAFRDVPLRVVDQVQSKVVKEWNEAEWRFSAGADKRKVYTGRRYPARIFIHELKLKRGDSIRGPLQAVVYVEPEQRDGSFGKPVRYLLHKRQKGDFGQKLDELIYVDRIELSNR